MWHKHHSGIVKTKFQVGLYLLKKNKLIPLISGCVVSGKFLYFIKEHIYIYI